MSFFKRLLSRGTAAGLAPEVIARRNVRFTLDDNISRHWYRGSPHITRFFDGLSLMFPLGEKIFIESVVQFRRQIETDAVLCSAVDAFVYQEATHIREHHAYNQRLAAQGAPVEALERMLLRRKERADRFPASYRLALTASIEHLTAIISDQVLRHPRVMAGADPEMARLWRWHALEETEHKAVTFDVLCAIEKNPLRRNLLRYSAMLASSVFFAIDVIYFTHLLARCDRQHLNGRDWLRLQYWLFINPGLFTRIIPAWLCWFVPGFHPDRLDSRAVLASARQALDEPR